MFVLRRSAFALLDIKHPSRTAFSALNVPWTSNWWREGGRGACYLKQDQKTQIFISEFPKSLDKEKSAVLNFRRVLPSIFHLSLCLWIGSSSSGLMNHQNSESFVEGNLTRSSAFLRLILWNDVLMIWRVFPVILTQKLDNICVIYANCRTPFYWVLSLKTFLNTYNLFFSWKTCLLIWLKQVQNSKQNIMNNAT